MKSRKRRKRSFISGKAGRIFILVVGLCFTAGVFFASGCFSNNDEKTPTVADISSQQEMTIEEKTEKILAQMSDAEKVGQMVMIGVHGTTLNDDIAYMLSEYNVGGVILFDRNMESVAQVTELNRQLQAQAQGTLPLFIGIDEEGGNVARMRNELTAPPSQQELGLTGNPEQAKVWAAQTAVKLKNMGFNVNFAPVADVGNDSAARMYSQQPEIVTSFVQSAVSGYEAEKLLCSLKHFPGIGRGEADSHNDFVNVPASAELLASIDIAPFKYMIDNGNTDNFWIMVTHVTYPAFDAANPASFSAAIITDLLRNKLAYQGIVITDDVDMGAIANYYNYDAVGVKSIAAGSDIVLVCHEYEHEIAVYNGILQAVQTGAISRERIDASVRRIIRAKLLHCM